MPELERLLQASFNGLSLGSIYALVAIGITLVFGLTSLINFAHGQFLVLGLFLAFSIHGDVPEPFIISLLVVVLVVGLFSFTLERVILRPTLDQPINGFIVTVGILIVMESLMVEIWGREQLRYFGPFTGVTRVSNIALSHERLLIIGASALLIGSLFVLLKKTELGRQIRAVSDDPEISELMGINVSRMISVTFVIGSVLAGMAGVFLGTLFALGPFDGAQFVVKGFAVALIGGLGNPAGAVVGAAILAMGESYIGTYIGGEWSDVLSFALMFGILLVRPEGILPGSAGARRAVLH